MDAMSSSFLTPPVARAKSSLGAGGQPAGEGSGEAPPEVVVESAVDEQVGPAATAEENQESAERASGSAPYKKLYLEGCLHKRKVQGFRNWKKRWVVLDGCELRWYDQPGGELRGEINLAHHSCVVKDRLSFKWSITDQAGHKSREFAATSYGDMLKWTEAINDAIDLASQPPPPAVPTLRPDVSDIKAFLMSLGLAELLPVFEAKGYTDMATLVDMGLTEADLDHLGVESPLARRVLCAALESNYSDRLRVEVLGHVQLGDSIYYKIKSKWRCWRSTTLSTYEELKALCDELVGAHTQSLSSTTSSEAKPIPTFPPKVDKPSGYFSVSMRAERGKLLPNKDRSIDDWFSGLAEAISGAPSHVANIALSFLELQPKMLR